MTRPSPARVVLSYGMFDQFSTAHAQHLSDLSRMGTELIIGCATDAFCARHGWVPRQSFDQRRANLKSCRFVDLVIAQNSLSQKRTDIVNYNASIIALTAQAEGQYDDLHDLAQVRYLVQRADCMAHALPVAAAS